MLAVAFYYKFPTFDSETRSGLCALCRACVVYAVCACAPRWPLPRRVAVGAAATRTRAGGDLILGCM